MQKQYPILIFAQSARFIAESATRGGYTVWVADCFCDTDTVQLAERATQLPPLAELNQELILETLQQLSHGERCYLVVGTGVERFYPLLATLPDHIIPLGNNSQTLARLRQASQFFPLLDNLALPHPEISWSMPSTAADDWLQKDLSCCGGSGIIPATIAQDKKGVFYQHRVKGISASVSFIANGKQAQILAINEQINRQASFALAYIVSPLCLTAKLELALSRALNAICGATGMKGLGSLDLLIDSNDHFYILELNPRFSASFELLPEQNMLFTWYFHACHGQLPDKRTRQPQGIRMLSYLYGDKTGHIMDQPNWPEQCHDLPKAGTLIETGAPICSILVKAETRAGCFQKLAHTQQLALQNLLPCS